MFRFTLFFCCCLLVQVAYSQQILKGRVFENKTRIPLAGIKIQNTSSKQLTETDSNGRFSIKADVNNILVLTGFAYRADTVMLTGLKEMEIFLEPQKNMLNEVKVTTSEATVTPNQPASFSFYNPDFHGQTIAKLTDDKGNYKGGIAIRLWWWKKDGRRQKKLEQQAIDDNVQLEISKAFASANLAKYLPLKNAELTGFSARYMPTAAAVRADSFNLLLYLNACYKEFIKLPPEQRTAPDIFHIKQ